MRKYGTQLFLPALQIFFMGHYQGGVLEPTLFLVTLYRLKLFTTFRTPEGAEDVSKYPVLFAALLESEEMEWTEEDLAKLASKNLIRVFKGRVCEIMSYEQYKKKACHCRYVPQAIDLYILQVFSPKSDIYTKILTRHIQAKVNGNIK